MTTVEGVRVAYQIHDNGAPIVLVNGTAALFQLWLDLLRTNRMAFLRLLLLSGLTPTFVSRLGVSALEDMINEYLPLANWDGIKRQVELDLAVGIREKTTKIRSPSLVINCTHDQIVTQTSGLAASIPNSTLRQLNIGHLAYFECGDEFLALITDFLGRRELSTPAGRRNPPVLTDGSSGSTRN